MSDGDSDPFRVPEGGPSPTPRPPSPPPPPSVDQPPAAPVRPPAPPPSPEQVARQRALTARLVLLALASAFTAVLAPPIGAVLGLLALVLAVRSAGVAIGLRVAVAFVGAVSLVIGIGVTAVAVAFRSEISTYSSCLQGANTRLAEQSCRDALDQSLQDRLGFAF